MLNKVKLGNAVLRTCAILWLCVVTQFSHAQADIVNVGGYVFPPFVEQGLNGNLTGVSFDLIAAFNQYQSKYKFTFIFTSPKRRYLSFQRNEFDMIMFESKAWGWQKLSVIASDVFLTGGEVYISKVHPNRDQSYFDSFTNKHMVGILGYHYGFANFISNEEALRKKFQISLTADHNGSIDMIRSDRGDIAVITKSFLFRKFKQVSTMRKELLVSEKFDQEYLHTILVRKSTHSSVHPSIVEINDILEGLKKNGMLLKIWRKYGIE